MKTEARFWQDTGDLDIIIFPDSPTEEAMLGLLASRTPTLINIKEKALEIVFLNPNRKIAK